MATLRQHPGPRDEEVRRAFGAGLGDEEIAADLGVTLGTIRKDRQYLGLLRAEAGHAPVPDARLVELHAAGLHNGLIADTTGLTRRTVQERLSRLRLRAHRTPR